MVITRDFRQKFIERTIAARKAANLERQDIADYIGVEYQAYQKYETRSLIPHQYLPKFCEATGIEPDFLYFGYELPKQRENYLIKELDVKAAAGGGQLVEDGQKVIAQWGVPLSALNGITNPDNVRIIQVTGDSMQPTYQPGQRVFVNIADITPSPPGVFVVWDGLGVVIKRCEHIPHSDPPRLILSSDNECYASYELPIAEAYINGRVIGKLEWC